MNMKRSVHPAVGALILVAVGVCFVLLLLFGTRGGGPDAQIERTIAFGAAGSPGSERGAPPPGVKEGELPPNMSEQKDGH